MTKEITGSSANENMPLSPFLNTFKSGYGSGYQKSYHVAEKYIPYYETYMWANVMLSRMTVYNDRNIIGDYILLYTLLYGFTTSRVYLTLGTCSKRYLIEDSYKAKHAIRQRLSYFVKNSYIKTTNRKSKENAFYYITSDGLDFLETRMTQRFGGEPYLRARLQLLYEHKPSHKNKAYSSHFEQIQITGVYASSIPGFCMYQSEIKALAFTNTGFYKNEYLSLLNKGSSLRMDALLVIDQGEQAVFCYIEQDSGSQNLNVLRGKSEAYGKFMDSLSERAYFDIRKHMLCFSCSFSYVRKDVVLPANTGRSDYIKDLERIIGTRHANVGSSVFLAIGDYMEFSQKQCSGSREPLATVDIAETIEDMITYLEQLGQTGASVVRYKKALQFYNDCYSVLHFSASSKLSFETFKTYISEHRAKLSHEYNQAAYEEYQKPSKMFINRRNIIRRANDNARMKRLCFSGFRIPVFITEDCANVMSLILLKENNPIFTTINSKMRALGFIYCNTAAVDIKPLDLYHTTLCYGMYYSYHGSSALIRNTQGHTVYVEHFTNDALCMYRMERLQDIPIEYSTLQSDNWHLLITYCLEDRQALKNLIQKAVAINPLLSMRLWFVEVSHGLPQTEIHELNKLSTEKKI